jgi:hypothetical protein
MKYKLICILSFFTISTLWASPFLSDLIPDYFFDINSLVNDNRGFTAYSGIDYTHLLEDENGSLNDYELASGILYQGENFNFNVNWIGSLLSGSMTVQGLDEVIDEGERDIKSDSFYNGFQIDFSSDYTGFSIYSLGDYAFYNLYYKTPELYGFYLSVNMEATPLTFFEADLVKNYFINGTIIENRINPYIGWKNHFIHTGIGYLNSEYSFTEQEDTEDSIVLEMDWTSVYGINAFLDLQTSAFDFEAEYKQISYNFSISGHTESTQILYMESENGEDKQLTALFREFSSQFSFFKRRLKVGGFYQSLYIPDETVNRAYIDMDPLSPVGILYRRKDVLENFGIFYRQLGGSIGTEWNWTKIKLEFTVYGSYVFLDISGDYYYMDGTVTPPFMVWTNKTVYDQGDISDKFEYLIFEPELSVSFVLGDLTLQATIRQLIPLELNEDLSINTDDNTDDDNDSDSSASLSGGFQASLLLSYCF